MTRMMKSLLVLLINTFTNRILVPEEYTKLSYNATIVTKDVDKGKMVVRIYTENKLRCCNIREKIVNITLLQLQQFNI